MNEISIKPKIQDEKTIIKKTTEIEDNKREVKKFDPVEENKERIKNEKITINKEFVDFKDLYIANKKNIISIHPNQDEVKKMKEEKGDDFYTIADDSNYYFSEAIEFLKTRSINLSSTDKRYIQFIMKDNDTVYVDTDRIEYKWVMILCDGYDKPFSSSLIDIDMNFEELDE